MSLAARVCGFFLAALALVLGGFSVTLYLLAIPLAPGPRRAAGVGARRPSSAVDVEPGQVVWEPAARPLIKCAHPDEDPVRWVVSDDQARVDREHVGRSGARRLGENLEAEPRRRAYPRLTRGPRWQALAAGRAGHSGRSIVAVTCDRGEIEANSVRVQPRPPWADRLQSLILATVPRPSPWRLACGTWH